MVTWQKTSTKKGFVTLSKVEMNIIDRGRLLDEVLGSCQMGPLENGFTVFEKLFGDAEASDMDNTKANAEDYDEDSDEDEGKDKNKAKDKGKEIQKTVEQGESSRPNPPDEDKPAAANPYSNASTDCYGPNQSNTKAVRIWNTKICELCNHPGHLQDM